MAMQPGRPASSTPDVVRAASDAEAPTVDAFRGQQNAARVRIVRDGLDRALDDWWQHAVLPPPLLLRDGLLVLEAGHTLDEPQRSLLLRAALAEHRGMLTALAHQTDPERTAVIIADALLAAPPDPAREPAAPAPLSLAELTQLRQEDPASNGWMAALHTVVDEETMAADAGRRDRALILRAALDADDWNVVGAARAQQAAFQSSAAGDWALIPGYPATAVDSTAGRFGPIWWRATLVLVALVAVALAVLWWQQRARFDNMVTVPAGVYPVSSEAGGGQAQASLAAFAIDRNEVTVGAYRTCMDRGACAQPASPASATRPNYLLDRAFEQYPIININWEAADRYCAFAGKRLPTAAEWEVAAGYTPSLNQLQAYPWGEQFKLQLANSAATGLGDTQVVGSYRPAGDSPFGASDLAGNVAEWTATNLGSGPDGGADRFMVKGGSFQDPPAALQVTAWADWESTAAAPWLGFRCAATVAGSSPPGPTSSAPVSSGPISSGPTTPGT